jgi:putative Mg2+ transporter-C (MgtC) family protein
MHFYTFWHALGHVLVQTVHSCDGIMAGRMLLTLLLCGVVGLERSAHERASGFRTHILVGLGACMMTLAGGYGFHDLAGSAAHGADPMRVTSYVVSGIGFLGAGAILRHGTSIRGMTTAASLWSAAGIGITVGAGLPLLAATAAGLILFTLVPLKNWEARLRLGQDAGDLAIHLRDDREAVGKTLVNLTRMGVAVKGTTIFQGAGETAVLRVDLARALRPEEVTPLVQRLLALKYVSRVDTRDLNLETEEETPDEDAVNMMEYDVPEEEAEGVPDEGVEKPPADTTAPTERS